MKIDKFIDCINFGAIYYMKCLISIWECNMVGSSTNFS